MPGPLSDLRVLDLSRLLPGPYCTLMLADLGAHVIKLEDRQGGDYLRHEAPQAGGMGVAFAYLNRGKRSVALSMRDPRGLEVVRRLAASCDVVVESFRPGMLDAIGLGYAALSAAHPRLIYCSISGYGQDGPLARRAGHDLNYLARAGASLLGGTRDGVPTVPGMQVADIGAGALMGVVAVLSALAQRARTGRGAHLDVSMTDGVMSMLSFNAAVGMLMPHQPPPAGSLLDGGAPCYRYYRCADGQYLAVGAIEPKFWERLCKALDLPHLVAADARAQGSRRDAVEAELEQRFASRPREAWMEVFAREDCCVDPLLTIAEAFQSEHARARGMTVEARVGDATLPQPACPLRFDGKRPLATEPAAALGQHTREELQAAGFTPDELEALAGGGVIGSGAASG